MLRSLPRPERNPQVFSWFSPTCGFRYGEPDLLVPSLQQTSSPIKVPEKGALLCLGLRFFFFCFLDPSRLPVVSPALVWIARLSCPAKGVTSLAAQKPRRRLVSGIKLKAFLFGDDPQGLVPFGGNTAGCRIHANGTSFLFTYRGCDNST